MLVKENLYINPKFKKPSLSSKETLWEIKEECMEITSLKGYITRFINEDFHPLDENATYYVGYIGSYTNSIEIFKGSYRKPITKGNLHYVEATRLSANLHLQSFTDSNILIKSVFLTEGEPDLVIPNKENFGVDEQPLLPPEGHYKEITPL